MNYRIESAEWSKIYGFLTTEKGLHTFDEENLRRFIEAVWYVARTGCQWRLLPDYYGHWRGVHRKFKHWCRSGVFSRMMIHFTNANMQAVIPDATIIRANA